MTDLPELIHVDILFLGTMSGVECMRCSILPDVGYSQCFRLLQTMDIFLITEWLVVMYCIYLIADNERPQTPLTQAIEATNKVFGMGIDIGTVLSVYSSEYHDI